MIKLVRLGGDRKKSPTWGKAMPALDELRLAILIELKQQ